MKRDSLAFNLLLGATAAVFSYLIFFIFFKTPTAQFQAGGIAQKIFYFHVPAIICGMYLSGAVCFLGSVAYLLRGTDQRNALAQAGAECAVAFGGVMLTSGPIWAKKAWGVYWTWDPQLTAALLAVTIYLSIVMLRNFGGDGAAERKFAAALGVLGTINLPIIHYSVKKWGGNHPVVMREGGEGVRNADMSHALLVGFLAMAMLCAVLLWLRTDLNLVRSRLRNAEQDAAARGIL